MTSVGTGKGSYLNLAMMDSLQMDVRKIAQDQKTILCALKVTRQSLISALSKEEILELVETGMRITMNTVMTEMMGITKDVTQVVDILYQDGNANDMAPLGHLIVGQLAEMAEK